MPQLFGILAQFQSRRPHIRTHPLHIKFRHRLSEQNRHRRRRHAVSPAYSFPPVDTDVGAGRYGDDAGVYWRYHSLLRRAAGNDSFSSQRHYHSPTMYAKSPAPGQNTDNTTLLAAIWRMHVPATARRWPGIVNISVANIRCLPQSWRRRLNRRTLHRRFQNSMAPPSGGAPSCVARWIWNVRGKQEIMFAFCRLINGLVRPRKYDFYLTVNCLRCDKFQG